MVDSRAAVLANETDNSLDSTKQFVSTYDLKGKMENSPLFELEWNVRRGEPPWGPDALFLSALEMLDGFKANLALLNTASEVSPIRNRRFNFYLRIADARAASQIAIDVVLDSYEAFSLAQFEKDMKSVPNFSSVPEKDIERLVAIVAACVWHE